MPEFVGVAIMPTEQPHNDPGLPNRSMPSAVAAFLLPLVLSVPLVAAEPMVKRDIPYAEPKSEKQTLDVYAPADGKNHPVVVWIHGGGWHSGDKKDIKQKPQAFVDRGFVFVSINYRLWPNVTIKEIAEDVARAIRWTHDHAKDHGGDPTCLFIMGHSAGAQLAALVCTDDRYLKGEKLSFTLLKGCVPVDGDTYDLPMRIETVRKSGNKKLAERDKQRFGDEKLQKELSSVTYIAKGKHIPPFLILHVADHPDTSRQSQRLLQALQDGGVPAKIYPAEGKDHTTLNDDLGTPGDKPSRALFEFVGEILKKPDRNTTR
jgi:acetyl esterase/lipase